MAEQIKEVEEVKEPVKKSTSKKVKVEVICNFLDKETNVKRKVGDTFEVSPTRLKVLKTRGLVK